MVEDARNATPASFDVVTVNWLLVNAKDRNELRVMSQGLVAKARPGGNLVTLIFNPDLYGYKKDLSCMKKYGLEFVQPQKIVEGATMVTRVFNTDGNYAAEVENYWFSKAVHIEELQNSGFEDIKLVEEFQLGPDENGHCRDPEDWEDFLSRNILMIITARKKLL